MNTQFKGRAIAGVIALATVLAGQNVGGQPGRTLEIGISGRANANASLATSGSFAGLVWGARTKDGVTDIFAATSRDGGRSFGAPVQVNRVPGEASLSGEQPPRIVLIPGRVEPSVVVTWTAKATSGTRLVSARSIDGGRSFGPAQPVPGSDGRGNRGWESTAVTAKGEVVGVWLDHRDVPARTVGGSTGGAHQHAATGQPSADSVARAQMSKIFFARLDEPGSGRAIAPGVCYCCKTSIATGGDGSIVAAWRHVYPGNIRDIALAKSSDGGRTFTEPVRVSDDNWVLDGCPENGPAVVVDQANAIHVVWPTLVPGSGGGEPTLALFYATSKDGRLFTKRQQIPTEGLPRHPQIALGPSGRIDVAWDEQAAGARRVVFARGAIDPTGSPRFVRELISDDAAAYPVVASSAGATIVAWTTGTGENTMLRVERRAR